jgi:hypothetical protein
MSKDELTLLIACVAGALALVAWAVLILAPAWSAYGRLWERVIASVLSVFVLAGFVLAGAGVGAAFLWYFDRL